MNTEIGKTERYALIEGSRYGRLKGNEGLAAQMVLTIDKAGLTHKVDGTIELG